jgi:hypothetical protein
LEQEAKELLRYIREELGRFYDENTAGLIYFIGAEHSCGGVIPLIRQAMLSRSKRIYVKPVIDKEHKKLTFKFHHNLQHTLLLHVHTVENL